MAFRRFQWMAQWERERHSRKYVRRLLWSVQGNPGRWYLWRCFEVRATRSWPLLPAGNSRVTCTSPAIPNAVLPEFEEFIDTELAEEADFIEEMDDQMDIAGDED